MSKDPDLVLALDQGTTSTRAMLFDRSAKPLHIAQKPLRQIYPQPAWVEHDPLEIWGAQSGLIREVLEAHQIDAHRVAAIGICNQRETAIVWERASGRPVHNAIVWQCRRSAAICDEFGFMADEIRVRTGLVLDPYFSATKLVWLFRNVQGLRDRAEKGELCFGTVDSWLLWNLTRGAVHATDVSNASRTMLLNIHNQTWDEELLRAFDIPSSILPRVCGNSEVLGHSDPGITGGVSIPISGMAGDQQAALFGHRCFEKGDVKNTYGTGCFMLMNCGSTPTTSSHGLLSTIAWSIQGEVAYALEGSVFIAGALVQWLRDELQLIREASETEALASGVADTGGVYIVPAFSGLGAPWWRSDARGLICGLTRSSSRSHIVRACLEAIAYQTRDVLEAMQADAGATLTSLRADGGASSNSFLMQFQADILGVPVEVAAESESSALGAAFLAGLAVGFWKDTREITRIASKPRRFKPAMNKAARSLLCQGWEEAVKRSL